MPSKRMQKQWRKRERSTGRAVVQALLQLDVMGGPVDMLCVCVCTGMRVYEFVLL
jgi:hypothetical protein